MVRKLRGPAYRSKENRIKTCQHLEVIVSHDFSVLLPVLKSPGKLLPLELNAAKLLKQPDRFRGYLGSNPVTGVKGNAVGIFCHHLETTPRSLDQQTLPAAGNSLPGLFKPLPDNPADPCHGDT